MLVEGMIPKTKQGRKRWAREVLEEYGIKPPKGIKLDERLAYFIVKGNDAFGTGGSEKERVDDWKRWNDQWMGKRVITDNGEKGVVVRIMVRWRSEVKELLSSWVHGDGVFAEPREYGSPKPAPYALGIKMDAHGHIRYRSPGYASLLDEKQGQTLS